MLPKTLVFSGGGTRCLVFLPALVELQKKNKLVHVEEAWGTSAGALIASLYLICRDAQKVNDLLFQTDLSKFRDIDVSNILTIHQSWGLDDGKSLSTMIETMLEEIGSTKTKTLSEVPGLHIVVSDLTLNKTIVLNSVTYPNIRIVDAIRASMSLPLFLRPYVEPGGNIWVDGALKHNFPWQLLPSDKARRTALGFAFKKQEAAAPKSLIQYVYSILNFNDKRDLEFDSNIIIFNRPDYPSWFVKFLPEDYTMVKEQGVKTITEWFNDSKPLQGTTGSSPLSEDHCNPSQVFLQHHTVGLSGSQTPFREQVQGSSPPQLLGKSPCYRRWSF